LTFFSSKIAKDAVNAKKKITKYYCGGLFYLIPQTPFSCAGEGGFFCWVQEFLFATENDAVILERSVSGAKNLRRFDVTSVFNGKKHPIGSSKFILTLFKTATDAKGEKCRILTVVSPF